MPRVAPRLFLLLSSAAAIAILLWLPAISVFKPPVTVPKPAQLQDEESLRPLSTRLAHYSFSTNSSANESQNQSAGITIQNTSTVYGKTGDLSQGRNTSTTNIAGNPNSNQSAGKGASKSEPENLPSELVFVDQKNLGYKGNTVREMPPTKGGRFLIFECTPEKGLCGGLGDREEGLVTVFLLAYLTQRRFGIKLTSPCDFSQFLHPNHYNWTVPDAELVGKRTRYIYAIDETPFSRGIRFMDFNFKYKEDVVFLQTNRDLLDKIKANFHYKAKLPSWAKQARPEFFRDVFQTLMKPSPSLMQRLEHFLRSFRFFDRTRPLVGVHVRTGTSKHFSDGPMGDKLLRLGTLWDFVQPYVSNGSDVFVATDNPEVHKKAVAKFGPNCHNTKAVLRHIDRQRNDPEICRAFEDSILDQLILMFCDVLVVSPLSGYSSRAAMLRGTNRQLFQFGYSISPADMYTMCIPFC